MPHQIGESIGHYQIVEELGVGGNGRVLKVQHLITRRREAMKILANGRPTSQEYAHRVLREIRLQASLDHPNIAAVLNAFWLEDDLVMIMELIDGTSLQKIIERRRFNLDQSLNLIRQVLIALSYAHANSVIHRDVSTANIVVSEDGRVKLTDFGLAKGSADMNITESGGMVGSPYYISPEQVRGTAATDHRSDIYSTGVVLYELLTGTRPFEAESTFLLMQAHVQHRPQAPIERNASIPQFINEAILKAMAKNPWDRFQSTADFLAALEGPVEKPLALPPLDTPVVPGPTPLSHSYAAPLPPIAQLLPKVASAGAMSSAIRRVMASPFVGAILGIGVVLAAVSPVLLYDFESRRPRFGALPKSLPSIIVPTPSLPVLKTTPAIPAEPLVAGPKAIPTLDQGNGGITPRRPTQIRRPVVTSATPPPPPQVVVWGDARASARPNSAPVNLTSPLAAPPQQAPPTATKKLEDPPILNSSKTQPILEPVVPQPTSTIPRKGLLRRLATGVKSLNPIRRENPTP